MRAGMTRITWNADESRYIAKAMKAARPITAAIGISTICVPAAATLKGPVRVWTMPLHSWPLHLPWEAMTMGNPNAISPKRAAITTTKAAAGVTVKNKMNRANNEAQADKNIIQIRCGMS